MASIRKLKTGVRAEVCVNGLRESRVFDSVKRAKVWAAMRETELRHDPHQANGKNVGDALKKYAKAAHRTTTVPSASFLIGRIF